MANRRRFERQVVWITGASSGIGEALAYEFAKEGAHVVLSARRRDELERVASGCHGASGVDVLPLDLGDPESLQPKADEIVRRIGRIDVLVHNAGVSQRARAMETSLATDRRIFEVNFFGVVALTKAVLPIMLSRKSGRFVVVTSLTGIVESPLRSTYVASKHALHGFFDSLRAEHHDDGIRVTLVVPGFVRTQISVNALTGDGKKTGKMDEATDKGISPERCAELVVDGIAKDRSEIYVGGFEVAGAYLKRLSPALFARMIRRAKVT